MGGRLNINPAEHHHFNKGDDVKRADIQLIRFTFTFPSGLANETSYW